MEFRWLGDKRFYPVSHLMVPGFVFSLAFEIGKKKLNLFLGSSVLSNAHTHMCMLT